jgi:hypothetical protein
MATAIQHRVDGGASPRDAFEFFRARAERLQDAEDQARGAECPGPRDPKP